MCSESSAVEPGEGQVGMSVHNGSGRGDPARHLEGALRMRCPHRSIAPIAVALSLTAAASSCPEDIDGNGTVDFNDLLQLLAVCLGNPGSPQTLTL